MLNKAVINLSALKDNVNNIKSRLTSTTKLCAVVKADAYGHGAEKISSFLYPFVDCFAVALIEEGISLRLCGIDKDILVLIPPLSNDDFSLAIDYGLTLSLSSKTDIKKAQTISQKYDKLLKVHLKYNTGMNRLGFDTLDDLKSACELISSCSHLILDGLYSHLAYPENDAIYNDAYNKFLLAKRLVKRYNKNVTCHLSASGGMLRGALFDMVRIGIMLYGYKPFETDKITLKPVMKVYAPKLVERNIDNGQGALYGNLTTKEPKTLSLIRLGYADGFFRKSTPDIFNNRCMDISAVIGKSEDLVLVMDDAVELANKYQTIPYEILVNCAKRAEKIYT